MSEVAVAIWNSKAKKYVDISWKRVTVRKSLDEICHFAEVEIPESERSLVHKHGIMQIRVLSPYITENRDSYSGRYGYHPVTTVYIDEIDSETEKASHGIVVVGRSKARDIIDSKWSGTLLGQPTLLEVLRSVAGEFGFTNSDVICIPTNQGDLTSPVFSFSWENESPWAKLLTIADAQGFIITSSQSGGLYIERPARGCCGWGLTEEQIKKLGGTYHKEIFWEVNLLIPVKLPSCGVNANMLVSQVEYTADTKSLTCDVTLVKPEAYR